MLQGHFIGPDAPHGVEQHTNILTERAVRRELHLAFDSPGRHYVWSRGTFRNSSNGVRGVA